MALVSLAAAPAAQSGEAVAQATGAFALDLYRSLRAVDADLCFSPYSILVALAMTREGAAGATAAEIDRVLHVQGAGAGDGCAALASALQPRVRERSAKRREVESWELHIANALWGRDGVPFHEPFTTRLADSYGAPLRLVDFQRPGSARRAINDWVAQQTKGRIADLVPEGMPAPETNLVLVNAIYFKAMWQRPFAREATADAPFTTGKGDRVDVPTMHIVASFRHASVAGTQVLEMPYRGGEVAMLIVLPDPAGGLPALEQELGADDLAAWTSALQDARVDVRLPRFSFRAQLLLADALQALGMRDAFDATRADFTRMTDARPTFVGAVLHEACVAVDEAGTEAAAATATVAFGAAAPPASEPIPFVVDRPFLFAIRHRETGCILFFGRVVDPRA